MGLRGKCLSPECGTQPGAASHALGSTQKAKAARSPCLTMAKKVLVRLEDLYTDLEPPYEQRPQLSTRRLCGSVLFFPHYVLLRPVTPGPRAQILLHYFFALLISEGSTFSFYGYLLCSLRHVRYSYVASLTPRATGY